MRAHLLLLCALTACATPSKTEDERAVLATVQAFFDVIASRDVAAGAELTVPEGVFVSVRERDGRPTLRHFSNAQWLAEMPSETARHREAFVGEPSVLVAGDVAVVFGRYVFAIDGEPSHGGVDAFNLLRTAAGWRIAGGAYTVVAPAR